jgi:uncharacterized membrane protein
MDAQATTSTPLSETSPSVRGVSAWRHVVSLSLPVILFLIPAGLLSWLRPDLAPGTWTFYSITVAGLDVGLGTAVVLNFEWWYILVWTMWSQALLAAFLLINMRLIRAWPRLDRFFARQELKALKAYEKHQWLRRFHFWGFCFFIVLPVGSGVYLGVVLGKMTGLDDRKTWLALMLGTAIWAAVLIFALIHAWDWAQTLV